MSQYHAVLNHSVHCAFPALLHAIMPEIWRLRLRFRRHLDPNYVVNFTIGSSFPKALTFTPLFLFVSSLLLLLSNHILICCTLFSCPLLSVARNLWSILSFIPHFIHLFSHSFIIPIHLFVHDLFHSSIQAFIHSFTHSLVHFFIHS